MNESKAEWYNYKTQQYDHLTKNEIMTDERAHNYIPQYPAALNMYSIYREMGMPILEAMLIVLLASVGRKE